MGHYSKKSNETSREFAYRILRDKIVSLEFEPGTYVSESEVAHMLGLSRTPIREALIELSKIDLVQIHSQKGSYISKIDYQIIEESRLIRLLLEIAIAQEACDIITEPDIMALENNIALFRYYAEQKDIDKIMSLDDEFHQMLFTITKKEFLKKVLMNATVHFDRVRRLSLANIDSSLIVEEHRKIVDALRARDKESVKEAVAKHLSRYKIDADLIREKYTSYVV
jgi:DNA-binding GntR family transcriptional regulator